MRREQRDTSQFQRSFAEDPRDTQSGFDAAGDPFDPEPISNDLPGVVGELRERLTQLIETNETLETDLGQARQQLNQYARDRKSLLKRLERATHAASAKVELETEIEQLHSERELLLGKMQDMSNALGLSEQRVLEIGRLLDKLRAERNDMGEEAACLSSQFSRAMRAIEELREALAAREEREETLEDRIQSLEQELQRVSSERDSYENELYESRNALDNVRKSLLAVSSEWREAQPGND
jgi:chromosome segregation ATPase